MLFISEVIYPNLSKNECFISSKTDNCVFFYRVYHNMNDSIIRRVLNSTYIYSFLYEFCQFLKWKTQVERYGPYMVRILTVYRAQKYGPYRSTWEVCLQSLFRSYSNSSNNDCQLLWNLTPIGTKNRKIYNNHCLRQVLLFNQCLNICMWIWHHIKISSVTKWIQDHQFDGIHPRRNIKIVQHLSSWFHIVKPPNKLAEVYYL
jgi:hypothetical protein